MTGVTGVLSVSAQVLQDQYLNSLTRPTISARVSASGNPLLSGTETISSVENSQEDEDDDTNLRW